MLAASGLAALGMALPQVAFGGTKNGARPGPYLIGADISWIPEDEAAGARYFVDGVQKDPILLLRDAGFNAIRLRIFVDPAKGYAKRDRRRPGRGWHRRSSWVGASARRASIWC